MNRGGILQVTFTRFYKLKIHFRNANSKQNVQITEECVQDSMLGLQLDIGTKLALNNNRVLVMLIWISKCHVYNTYILSLNLRLTVLSC